VLGRRLSWLYWVWLFESVGGLVRGSLGVSCGCACGFYVVACGFYGVEDLGDKLFSFLSCKFEFELNSEGFFFGVV